MLDVASLDPGRVPCWSMDYQRPCWVISFRE